MPDAKVDVAKVSGGRAGSSLLADSRAKWVLAATTMASAMAFVDGTAVTVALPALQTGLHANANEIQWVIEAYALFLASLLLVGGSLGDRFGRRKVFVGGVGLFLVGSLACGLAPTIFLLIAARAVQGVGAALLVPGSLSILSAFFPQETRGRAIGIWSGFSAITAAVGPVLGGWLVDQASWRWVFFINLPLALATLLIAFWRVPESRNEGMRDGLDWVGAVLGTVGLAGVTFSLIEAHRGGLALYGAAALGAVCLVALWFYEMRVPEPMLPLHMFRSRDFAGASLLTLFLYTALNGLLFFFPINLIQVQRYTATEAGAALLPMILILFALSHWSGGLIERYGARGPLTVGSLVAGLGFALAGRPTIGGSYWTTFFPAVSVLGFGMAICVAPLTTAAMNAVPVDEAGAASGVNNAISRLASLLSVAVCGVVLLTSFRHDLRHRLDQFQVPPAERQAIVEQRFRLAGVQTTDAAGKRAVDEAFVYGFHRIIWLAVGLCLASAGCAQILKPGKDSSSEHDKVSWKPQVHAGL